jgi:hypothetical protein
MWWRMVRARLSFIGVDGPGGKGFGEGSRRPIGGRLHGGVCGSGRGNWGRAGSKWCIGFRRGVIFF